MGSAVINRVYSEFNRKSIILEDLVHLVSALDFGQRTLGCTGKLSKPPYLLLDMESLN